MPDDPSPDTSPRNRGLFLSPEDRERLVPALDAARRLASEPAAGALADRVALGDAFAFLPRLPRASVDLLVADPPYNLDRDFGATRSRRMDDEAYEAWTGAWLDAALPALKPGASVYVFGDWRGSSALYRALRSRLLVRNRVVWEREKGRAARDNWKSAHEEIWYAVLPGAEPRFDAAAVRLRRRVLAPYRDGEGAPKDWSEEEGGRFRDTAASNIWTDLSVPFWSMPENTPHPAQKPEKLLAKIILASSAPGDLVLDPFLGSGTSAVAAKKLGRRYLGVELDPEHCLHALRRLELAETDRRIQGYEDGVFWERNAAPRRRKSPRR